MDLYRLLATSTDPWTLALDTALGLLPRLLKQSTPASTQCPGISCDYRRSNKQKL